MAAPTQELPPWLSYSTFITRGETSSSLVELPLTYYGPSIPLGTNGVWTYGGLTSPASSIASRSSTATPSPTLTPSPTTSSGSASLSSSGSVSPPIPPPTASSTSAAPSTTLPSSLSSSSSPTATPSSSIPNSSTSLTPSAIPSLSSLSSASASSLSSASVSSVSSLSSSSISSASSASLSSASISSTSLSSASISSASSTSSSSPLPIPPSSSLSTINKPALIGIVLGSIFGTVLILLLLLLCLRWRRRRQNGGYQTPIWTGWEIVDPSAVEHESNNGEDRPPGEGSPRGSGEEADSFLRRSGTTNMTDIGRSVSIPAAAAGSAAGAGAAAAQQGTNNSNGSGSSGGNTESTAVSDYGVLLSEYTARRSSDMGFFDEPRGGYILPPSELLRLENERMETEHMYGDEPRAFSTDEPQQYSPLMPPPPLDPDRNLPHSAASTKSSFSMISAQEDPVVMSARRVQMSEVGPRGSEESSPVASTSGGWGSLGLGGIARLSRLSWFKSLRENLQDSPTTPKSRPQSYVGVPLSDSDLEAGRASLGHDLKRPAGLGSNVAGERPISSISTKSAMSGSTVYHDAQSTPGTPPPLPPMPRAYMATHPDLHGARSGSTMGPPAYESEQTMAPAGQIQAAKDGYAPRLVDVLDMPAPVSMSQFSSISSRGGPPFPPGLAQLPTPRSWYESSSSEAGDHVGITIDVLEDAPPQAGDGWRVLARNAGMGHPEHRSSFGIPQFVHPRDMSAISEVGSLHSMRSHLNPFSGRSSGSAPASSLHRLDGSNSSRPSGHSAQRTTSSGQSLAHSGSISSDGRRRLRGNVSPSLSAFGPQDSPITGQYPTPPAPPPPYLPRSPLVGLHDTALRDINSPGSSRTSHDHDHDEGQEIAYSGAISPLGDQFSPDSQLLTMPWATGLDNDD